jgi:hypothetical protein
MTYKLNYLSRHVVDNDRPQNLTLSYAYELPFGPGKRFVNTTNPVGQLVRGWRLAGIDIYTKGTPITVATSFFQDGIGSWPVRDNSQPATLNSCGSAGPSGPNAYLNPAAFVNPALFSLGNTSTLPSTRNCAYFNEDLSIQRVIKIGEHFDVLFSADSSNLFNRHTFTGLQTNISQTGAFGRFSGATAPRQLQLHLKLEF